MNAPLPTSLSLDLSGLQHALLSAAGLDALQLRLSTEQWLLMGQYMQPFTMTPGQVLIKQGAQDRNIYLVEGGSLSVHFEDGKSRVRLAMVGAGSVVGEGAFFSHQPRTATVQSVGDCRLWGLTPMRYTELANRHPALALALVQALGGVLARRQANKPKRTAIT